jgi:hypothetical protein
MRMCSDPAAARSAASLAGLVEIDEARWLLPPSGTRIGSSSPRTTRGCGLRSVGLLLKLLRHLIQDVKSGLQFLPELLEYAVHRLQFGIVHSVSLSRIRESVFSLVMAHPIARTCRSSEQAMTVFTSGSSGGSSDRPECPSRGWARQSGCNCSCVRAANIQERSVSLRRSMRPAPDAMAR